MRTISYLSPTSISLFKENREEFYLNYLSDARPPRLPQTQPMSVGSAFDAYAKSYLHEKLIGKDPRFELSTIFEAQVSSHNRDWALAAGKYAFHIYQKSGALSDLMLDIEKGIGPPRFEIEVRGVIDGHREGVTKNVGDIILLGKPDLFYINASGGHVIFDWKVNGFCSKNAVSPMAGYVKIRENGIYKGCHRDAICMNHKGMMINIASYLEDFDDSWARQLSIYAWLCGMEIGTDFIVAVDQLACKPGLPNQPEIRVAEHRLRVRPDHQWKIFAEAQECWEVVHSDWIFRELPYEQSILRQQQLDGIGTENLSDEDKWFWQACRG